MQVFRFSIHVAYCGIEKLRNLFVQTEQMSDALTCVTPKTIDTTSINQNYYRHDRQRIFSAHNIR
ncbi:MAG: hypothetical protein JNM36_06880 [Chitinophagales bacterium]|jgi:hypothetical protein|nr:hypothetical protein [Chitinophagales bacterium]